MRIFDEQMEKIAKLKKGNRKSEKTFRESVVNEKVNEEFAEKVNIVRRKSNLPQIKTHTADVVTRAADVREKRRRSSLAVEAEQMALLSGNAKGLSEEAKKAIRQAAEISVAELEHHKEEKRKDAEKKGKDTTQIDDEADRVEKGLVQGTNK